MLISENGNRLYHGSVQILYKSDPKNQFHGINQLFLVMRVFRFISLQPSSTYTPCSSACVADRYTRPLTTIRNFKSHQNRPSIRVPVCRRLSIIRLVSLPAYKSIIPGSPRTVPKCTPVRLEHTVRVYPHTRGVWTALDNASCIRDSSGLATAA